MRRQSKSPKKPTYYQARVLQMIAQSRLMKTHDASRLVPIWTVDGGEEITHECAQTLIRHGWVVPQRDGLLMFDETQTYKALKP